MSAATSIRSNVRPARNVRGLVLPMVLVVITLMALLSASFAFQINAHRAAVRVMQDRVQLREAAEAGIHHAMYMLRENRHDATLWWDNEEFFHNRVVWSAMGDWSDIDVPDAIEPGQVTFRYSLVADDPDDDYNRIRYGITDETSKLHLNVATGQQFRRLFEQVLPEEVEIAPLVDALIDWRDADNTPGPEGAEQDYYSVLNPPYKIKNGNFETVEELLLVRGFTAGILFGEDVDRNGLLTVNEDDGYRTFPPDNEDTELQRGIAPFLTVWTQDLNRANDNVPRADLNGSAEALEEALDGAVDEDVLAYIATARTQGVTFTNPIELLGFEPPQPSSPPAGDGAGDGSGDSAGDGDASGDAGDAGDAGGADAGSGDTGAGDPGDPAPPADGAGRGNNSQDAGPQLPPSPVQVSDLGVLCDRTTAIRQQGQIGLININTAPLEVLNCLVNGTFTEDDVNSIINARISVPAEDLETLAWPVAMGVVDPAALSSIYPQITARSQQFTIDAIGHADHIGQMVRLQAVIELRGQVPQFLYYRDITEVGTRFPIRGGGEEFVRDRS